MSKVISISREFGSGGREIGYCLAKKLGVPFYDQELIAMASEQSNIHEDIFYANDEMLAGSDRAGSQYVTVDPFSSRYEVPMSDQIFFIQTNIIKRLAQNGPCVIIGRCSDVIIEDSFKVFICASLKKRVERLLALEKDPDIDHKKMEARIRQIDAKRRDYYQYYSGNEWGKAKNYHLCLSSDKLGINTCVDIIAASLKLL